MSKTTSTGTPAVSNKFAKMDEPMVRKDFGVRVAVGRVKTMCDLFPGNIVNDRISLEPKKAAWAAQRGLFIVEIASADPADIEAAGGVDGYLKEHPAKDKLSRAARAKIAPIPGKPSEADLPPWEFVDVDED